MGRGGSGSCMNESIFRALAGHSASAADSLEQVDQARRGVPVLHIRDGNCFLPPSKVSISTRLDGQVEPELKHRVQVWIRGHPKKWFIIPQSL